MKRIGRNSLYNLASFVISTFLMVLSYRVLVGHFGEARFGVFVLSITIGATIALLDCGFSVSTTKFVAEDVSNGNASEAADVISTALVFYAVFGLISAGIVWWTSTFLAGVFSIPVEFVDEAIWVFRITAFQFLFSFLLNVMFSVLKGLHRFDINALGLFLINVIYYGSAAAWVILAKPSLIDIACLGLVTYFLLFVAFALVANWLCASAGVHFVGRMPTKRTFERMLRFGLAIGTNNLSNLLIHHLPRYLIGSWLGPSFVTIYHLGTTVPSKVHSAVNAFSESLLPIASESKDLIGLRRIYVKTVISCSVLAIPTFAVLCFFSKPLLDIWLNTGITQPVSEIMPPLAIAFLALSLSLAPIHLLTGVGKPWINTVFFVSLSLANLAFVFLFWGISPSVQAFSWAMCAASTLSVVAFFVSLEVFFWRRQTAIA